jgi:hypothetical protein
MPDMMKKILNITLILILTLVTMGFSVSQHYCGGQLVSVSVNETAESCCGPVGTCCQNEIIHLQLDDDFVVEATYELLNPADQEFFFYAFPIVLTNELSQKITVEEKFSDFSPPLDLKIYLASLQTFLL